MKRLCMASMVMLAAVVAGGCGGGASLSPTGPSATPGGGGTSIIGSVNGLAAPSLAAGAMAPTGLGSSLTVTIAGTNVSAQVDSTGQFALANVPPGDIVLQFSGRGVDARVTISGVSAGDQISLNVVVSGNSAVVTHESRVKSDHKSEIEGLITAKTAAGVSPRTVTVDSRTVTVPVAATIRKGNTIVAFDDLKVGQRVHVKASTEGTTLMASEVIVQNEDVGDDDDVDHELHGVVSGLSGTCPTITFTVAATSVTTSAATNYKDGACVDVKDGATVEVKAMKPTSGPWPATRIQIEKD